MIANRDPGRHPRFGDGRARPALEFPARTPDIAAALILALVGGADGRTLYPYHRLFPIVRSS